MQQVRLRAAPVSPHSATTHAAGATYHIRTARDRAFLQTSQLQFEARESK